MARSGKGNATGPANALETRAFSCKTATAGECSGAEAEFADDNVATYHVLAVSEKPPASGLNFPAGRAGDVLDQTPSSGPQISYVRLGDNSGLFACADVRAAIFP